MITPNNKVKVFISSICGKEKYNITRKSLKLLIEFTQLATVYLFGDCGAATVSAEDHYEHTLQDSDICIFLIDNKYGVSVGVQKEIDCANKYGIKSLYYFCDQFSKKETPLQKSLMGAKIAKSTTIHSFEELIEIGMQDLIDDILFVYKDYCKGRIQSQSAEESMIDNYSISDLYFNTSLVVNKKIISNIDRCKSYFLKMVLGKPSPEEKTNEFDALCSKFLPILFDNKPISDFNVLLLQDELSKSQEANYHSVIKLRWVAIQAYFTGDLVKCVDGLEKALSLAKGNKLPDWLIKDIFIDLRNQRSVLYESRNEYHFDDNTQEEIQNSEHPLHYPLLDRFESNLYEQCIKKQFKKRITSHSTVVLGNDISAHIELLANIFIVSMFNGSLTHILILYKRIQLLSFYLCENYSDWNFRLLILKSTIMNHTTKEIDGITSAYADILCKMNSEDALSVYRFSSNVPIKHQRLVCNLEAFKIVGYFLSDEDFREISQELLKEINIWVNTEDSVFSIGNHILDMFANLSLRMNSEDMAIFCSRIFEKKHVRRYNDVLKFIAIHLDINKISQGNAKQLITNVIHVVCNESDQRNYNNLKQALYSLRKRNYILTEELDHCIQEHMPDFYNGDYLLETTKNEKEDLPNFIHQYIDEMVVKNETQGANGIYYGYMNRPYITIKAILEQSSIVFETELIDLVFKTASKTLQCGTQTIEIKCDAIELIIFLSNHYPELISRNHDVVQNILSHKDAITSGQSMMSNLTKTALQLSSQFLCYCFGEDCYLTVIEMLPHITDDISAQIQVSKIIATFLDAEKREAIYEKLEVVLLQLSIQWCESDNLDIRWYAVRILFHLLRNPLFSDTIGNQIVQMMDFDNVYIKNSILNLMSTMKNKNQATYEYVLQKASVDTNYVVRKVYAEIIDKDQNQ